MQSLCGVEIEAQHGVPLLLFQVRSAPCSDQLARAVGHPPRQPLPHNSFRDINFWHLSSSSSVISRNLLLFSLDVLVSKFLPASTRASRSPFFLVIYIKQALPSSFIRDIGVAGQTLTSTTTHKHELRIFQPLSIEFGIALNINVDYRFSPLVPQYSCSRSSIQLLEQQFITSVY